MMTTILRIGKRLLPLGAALALLSGPALALTPLELLRLQKDGAKLRLIDVRPTALFAKGSIPGAMSVPAAVLLEKQFPPLGRVVLISSGLGDPDLERYVQALNQRSGTQAEALEGGYAAWLDEKGTTTAPAGLRESEDPLITYDKLASLPESVVLIDLRKQAPANASGATDEGAAVDPVKTFCEAPRREYCRNLEDLHKRFAKRPQLRSPLLVQSKSTHEPTPLLVLVDDDHVTAREQCRRLKVAGYNRIVVLVGGELAIETRGTSGMGRVGGKILDGRFGPEQEESK